MNKHRSSISVCLLTFLSALSPGCLVSDQVDYYSQVASVCMDQDPKMGLFLGNDTKILTETYLKEACKTALESVIPYDLASFESAPEGMKDKITEAFQAIIAYPLLVDVNDTKFLGVQPQLAGAIPVWFTDIYRKTDNPNQSLFNYILNHTDSVYYGGVDSKADAEYGPITSVHPRRITIYRAFWDITVSDADKYREPFVRASTLAHEARHGDVTSHTLCDAKKTGATGFSCDEELQGAYGFGAVYLKYLLHGSATCSTPGCISPLAFMNVLHAGWHMCVLGQTRINNRFPELEAIYSDKGDCRNWVTYDWIMQQEGIPYPGQVKGQTSPPPSSTSQKRITDFAPNLHVPSCFVH